MGVSSEVTCEQCGRLHKADLNRMLALPNLCECGNDIYAQIAVEQSIRATCIRSEMDAMAADAQC